jgi:hypothetical protein
MMGATVPATNVRRLSISHSLLEPGDFVVLAAWPLDRSVTVLGLRVAVVND